MKIEKKLIVLSILALTIGIATITPLAFFMTTNAQTDDNPWFSVDPLFAYFRVDLIDGGYCVSDVVKLQTLLNDKALKQSETRIEYFEFNFYTDNQQLLKHTFWISMTNNESKNPVTSWHIITENPWRIINENLLNSSYLGTDFLSGIDVDLFNDLSEMAYTRGFGNTFGSKDDKFNAVLEAQTIYLDVSRVCYVTIKGDTTEITWANNQNVQHFELTKSGGAFIFGNDDNSDTLDTWVQQASVDLSDTTMDDYYVELETKYGIADPR
ncbi:MAG: hypothetical protein FWF66_00665 [Candidatus Bathyarchaeota archaeon]|nr:hypothetical protein [Candidatus Termiticorpusculum sp.]